MDQLYAVQHAYLIPLLPLIGAVIAGFFGAKWLKGQSHWPIWIGVGFSALLSLCLIAKMWPMEVGGHAGEAKTLSVVSHWYTWIAAGNFRADAGAFIDPLTGLPYLVWNETQKQYLPNVDPLTGHPYNYNSLTGEVTISLRDCECEKNNAAF